MCVDDARENDTQGAYGTQLRATTQSAFRCAPVLMCMPTNLVITQVFLENNDVGQQAPVPMNEADLAAVDGGS